MYDIKTFESSFVKEEVEKQKSVSEPYSCPDTFINGGFPVFNECGHTTIDLTNVTDLEDNNMHTLSIKLDNDGTYLTVCVMPMMGGNYINADVKFHSLNENRCHRSIHFGKGGNVKDDNKIEDLNLLALISEVKSNK